VHAVYCVGSYARGNWGVGSDVDLIVLLTACELSRVERLRRYDPIGLPVHCDLMVFTPGEWDRLQDRSPHFFRQWQNEKLDLLE